MFLSFYGAAHEVTGSLTLIEACNKRILVDCGMEQGENIFENVPLPYSASQIDAVFLTHAHIDHSGMLPHLVANGFSGNIYSTEATHDLCKIMLADSAHIQESEAAWKNKKAARAGKDAFVPLYTVNDAQNTIDKFLSFDYNKKIDVFDGISIRFIDAGHLLGSASIEVTITENGLTKTVLFSGDLGNVDRPLLRDPQMPQKADYVVIESTYGDRVHPPRPDYIASLCRILQSTFDKGGNVVIPCFAVGRTQELLYLLRIIKEKQLIKAHPHFPVYVDSPMAIEATQIYSEKRIEFFDEETAELIKQNINPLIFDDLILSVTADESRAINEDYSPKVILSSSGMCEAGRIRHHLKHNLWRENSTVLFVGYQSVGTLGRRLIEGASEVKLFGEEIVVRANVETLSGISGHADKNMLISWLSTLSPQKVFVNHGSDGVCDEFAALIKQELSLDAYAPYSSDAFDLSDGSQVAFSSRKRIEKKRVTSTSPIYLRLLDAYKRLYSVIEQNSGSSNKVLGKMCDQILALCEKYQK